MPLLLLPSKAGITLYSSSTAGRKTFSFDVYRPFCGSVLFFDRPMSNQCTAGFPNAKSMYVHPLAFNFYLYSQSTSTELGFQIIIKHFNWTLNAKEIVFQ